MSGTKEHRNSIRKNAALNGIRRITATIFPVITMPYILRVLQVENVGIYQFSSSVVSYFLLIAALGISTYAIREGAGLREDREKISRFSNEVFALNLMSTAAAYALLGILLVTVPKFHELRTAILLFSIEIFFTTLGVEWIYQINEDYTFITIRSILFQLISLALMFLLVRSESDLYVYIVITVVASVGANVINFAFSKKYFDIRTGREYFAAWRKHIRPVLIIFSSNVAITIYVSLDILMLGFMTDNYTVGLYTTASKIYTIIKNLMSAVLIVTIPRFSMLAQRGDAEEFNATFRRAFRTILTLLLPASTGVIFLGKEITYLAGGKEYLPGAADLTILGAAIVFSLFAFLYTQCVLIPYHHEKIILCATSISAVSNVLLNLILIPVLRDRAAAITTVIAEAVTCIIAYVCSRRYVRVRGIAREVLSVAAGCAAIAGICVLMKSLIGGMFPRTAAAVALSVLAYALILLVFKNETLRELMRPVLRRLVRSK